MEVQSLRNQVEQQAHALSQMRENQRRRYIDLDERLQDHSQRLTELEALPTETVQEDIQTASTQEEEGNAEGQQLTAQQAYAQAYQLVPERRFDEAILAFQNFIKDYPDSRLVGNGYYWLGEIHMAQNRTQEAEQMFEAVVRRFPASFKLADSKYKLGLINARYGKEEEARRMMQSIVEEHPNEPAAELARSWLNR